MQEHHKHRADTLADLRQYVSCYPEAIYLDYEELAYRLGYPAAEVAAALEALAIEGEALT